mmetsp:Transcript_52383/g.109281  ORF Transcript_52383/g.109281 Transcript_52383/m.109281 type:complete len:515 (-) Transcript_52383:93-1637(-)
MNHQEVHSYLQALQQIRLGIRDGGCGCYNNKHIIHAAYYSSVADTIRWLHAHPLNPSWLKNSLSQTLTTMIQPSIDSLHQTWNLPIATTCPPQEIRNKADLPLSIPSPQCIPHWPQHLFPTQGDFGRHIKAQIKANFFSGLPKAQQARVKAVGRHHLITHRTSHLSPNIATRPQLWQCSTSLFSLTSFYELSNEAFLTSTSLLLGIPIPHAIYLQATQPEYAKSDIWADSLLNKSKHAAETRKTTHTKFAQELTRIASECGIPTTCNESRLPYRDEGQTQKTRKRADLMTLTGGVIPTNFRFDFTSNTRLIMDVTIGHTFDLAHHFKAKTLQTMEASKRRKYARHYMRQRMAFAPMVANTLGQCGPDLLQFLWTLADHHAKLNLGFSTDNTSSLSSQQEADYRKIRGQKYHEIRLRILTCLFESVATRVFGKTFDLTCSANYYRWLNQKRHDWIPFLPNNDPISSSFLPTSLYFHLTIFTSHTQRSNLLHSFFPTSLYFLLTIFTSHNTCSPSL